MSKRWALLCRLHAQSAPSICSAGAACAGYQQPFSTAARSTVGGDGDGLSGTALAALKRGEWATAWQLAKEAFNGGERTADVLYTRGGALARLGCLHDAEGYLQMALAEVLPAQPAGISILIYSAHACSQTVTRAHALQDRAHDAAKAALSVLPELHEDAEGRPQCHKMYFDPLRRPFAEYIGHLELFRTEGDPAMPRVLRFHACTQWKGAHISALCSEWRPLNRRF